MKKNNVKEKRINKNRRSSKVIDPVIPSKPYISPYIYVGIKQSKQVSMTLDIIMDACCGVTGMNKDDIISRSRIRRFSYTRFLFSSIARKYTSKSLSEIGRYLGNRDHSTVMHHISVNNDLLDFPKVNSDYVSAYLEVKKALFLD